MGPPTKAAPVVVIGATLAFGLAFAASIGSLIGWATWKLTERLIRGGT